MKQKKTQPTKTSQQNHQQNKMTKMRLFFEQFQSEKQNKKMTTTTTTPKRDPENKKSDEKVETSKKPANDTLPNNIENTLDEKNPLKFKKYFSVFYTDPLLRQDPVSRNLPCTNSRGLANGNLDSKTCGIKNNAAKGKD